MNVGIGAGPPAERSPTARAEGVLDFCGSSITGRAEVEAAGEGEADEDVAAEGDADGVTDPEGDGVLVEVCGDEVLVVPDGEGELGCTYVVDGAGGE